MPEAITTPSAAAVATRPAEVDTARAHYRQPSFAAASRSREHIPSAHRAPRCCHVKANGLRCGSPALRSNVFCYFHDKWLNNAADDILPPLEDGNGVQFALMWVVTNLRKEAFRNGEANIPAVKQLLYALQTASHNLRYCNFDPRLKSSTTDPFAPDADMAGVGMDAVEMGEVDMGEVGMRESDRHA